MKHNKHSQTSWEKDYDKRWLPDKKFEDRPEYKEAIKLCNEQKQFIKKELKKERIKMGKKIDKIKQKIVEIRANTNPWLINNYCGNCAKDYDICACSNKGNYILIDLLDEILAYSEFNNLKGEK